MSVNNINNLGDIRNNDVNQALQDLLNQINQEYDLIDQIEQAIEQNMKDQAQINQDVKDIDRWNRDPNPFHWRNNDRKAKRAANEIAALKKEMAANNEKIKQAEATLVQLDPGFKDLIGTLNNLIDVWNQFKDDPKELTESMKLFEYVQKIVQAMKAKAEADEDKAILESDTGKLSREEILERALDMVQKSFAEKDTLQGLSDEMSQDYESFLKEENTARIDKSKIHWYNRIFNENRYKKDEKTIQSMKTMMDLITQSLNELAPEMASLSPEFVQATVALNDLLEDVKKILNSDVSSAEKRKGILNLMVLALGLLNTLISLAARQKAENDQRMSQGSVNSSRMGVENQEAEQKILNQQLKYAKAMKQLVKVATIVMGVIMTITAPGLGSAALMATLTGLEASGTMDKLTDLIAKSLAKHGAKGNHEMEAAAIVGAIEILVVVVGGAFMDGAVGELAEKAADTAARTAAIMAEQIVQRTVTTLLENIGRDIVNAAERQVVRDLIETSVADAMKQASQKTFQAFSKQSLIHMAGSFKTLPEKMVRASLEAAERVSQDLIPLAEEVLAGGVVPAATLELVVEKAAQEAAAAALNTTARKVAAQKAEKTALEKAGSRGLYSTIYAIGSNNLLIDLVTAIQKAQGKDQEDLQDWLKILLGVVQSLMAVFAQVSGSGLMSAETFSGTALTTSLTRILQGSQLGASSAQIIGQGSQADADFGQAKAIRAIGKDNAMIGMLHFVLEQIRKDGNLERDRFLKELENISKTTLALSSHLDESGAVLAKVLAGQAV